MSLVLGWGFRVMYKKPFKTAVPSDGLLAVTGGFFQKFREDGDLPKKISDCLVSEKTWNFCVAQRYVGLVKSPEYKGDALGFQCFGLSPLVDKSCR